VSVTLEELISPQVGQTTEAVVAEKQPVACLCARLRRQSPKIGYATSLQFPEGSQELLDDEESCIALALKLLNLGDEFGILTFDCGASGPKLGDRR